MILLETIPFDLLHPSKWMADQTGNVINFFSAIGTVGALAYAIVQGLKNKEDIQLLAGMVTELKNQNQALNNQHSEMMEQTRLQKLHLQYQLRPSFVHEEIKPLILGRYMITLRNKGHKAIVKDYVIVSEQFEGFTRGEVDLEMNETYLIMARPKNSDKSQLFNGVVKIYYEDVFANRYVVDATYVDGEPFLDLSVSQLPPEKKEENEKPTN